LPTFSEAVAARNGGSEKAAIGSRAEALKFNNPKNSWQRLQQQVCVDPVEA